MRLRMLASQQVTVQGVRGTRFFDELNWALPRRLVANGRILRASIAHPHLPAARIATPSFWWPATPDHSGVDNDRQPGHTRTKLLAAGQDAQRVSIPCFGGNGRGQECVMMTIEPNWERAMNNPPRLLV